MHAHEDRHQICILLSLIMYMCISVTLPPSSAGFNCTCTNFVKKGFVIACYVHDLYIFPCIFASHGNQEGLTAARKLCESLIQTVQKDHEGWKRSQQPLGYGGQAPPCKTTCTCAKIIIVPLCGTVEKCQTLN